MVNKNLFEMPEMEVVNVEANSLLLSASCGSETTPVKPCHED